LFLLLQLQALFGILKSFYTIEISASYFRLDSDINSHVPKEILEEYREVYDRLWSDL